MSQARLIRIDIAVTGLSCRVEGDRAWHDNYLLQSSNKQLSTTLFKEKFSQMAVHYYMVLLVHTQETETKKEIIKASLYREIVVWMM